MQKHKLSIADIITLSRIAGTVFVVFLKPLSMLFFLVYAFTGLTDLLDGWIARKTNTSSDFGARLDSIADLMFYAVMLFRIFPSLWSALPVGIWYAVGVIIVVRILSYIIAAIKYHRFASVHTYMNKVTGVSVFLVPFMLVTKIAVGYCIAVCAVALAASVEETVLHIHNKEYAPNRKTIFQEREQAEKSE